MRMRSSAGKSKNLKACVCFPPSFKPAIAPSKSVSSSLGVGDDALELYFESALVLAGEALLAFGLTLTLGFAIVVCLELLCRD